MSTLVYETTMRRPKQSLGALRLGFLITHFVRCSFQGSYNKYIRNEFGYICRNLFYSLVPMPYTLNIVTEGSQP